ncbi:crotonase/enoyl-CoA hydratase family protein [Streptomyces pristinaespiralis]|uniref:Enoyl-CoA hydratase n=2 Tax=Streptomyces pristinaespiralis TaxID=38300 RepID=B5H6T6_STRE2|nr:crotonase/enoyl-CoA hydratase family protein [Streptomyces pristinaespiralis]ALC18715.1 enoyl-CoA hydratase [Streptomyces pristinaespiralis]EDY62547.1 enoyl-CoA hydratase [Streptomyces pristinaespiralis ATCC 25486]QMU18122.1 crotonase/enoyl-CoA hydratase family protein [Streptomyces pristinaespiralis]
MTDQVLTEFRGDGIAVITINRPEARNALDRAVGLAVAQALDELDHREDLRIGILTGAGGTFCAGADLKAMLRGETALIEGRGLCGLTETPPRKPLIAAVEGYALAGGCELVLACDLVVAAEDATLGIPEVKRGLVAAAGGLTRLHRLIPHHMAMELALTGRFMEATQAHGYGLVNRLTAPGAALEGALALAGEIAMNGPLAVQASKQIITESDDWPADERWKLMREISDPVFASEDAKEGPRAFTEKRAPKWSGR